MSAAKIEELLRDNPRMREVWNNAPPPPKPKVKPAVLATVSEQMAAAINANPDSLRVSARADGNVTIVERPDQRRPQSRVMVIEVDRDGRPSLVKECDAEGRIGFARWEGGYGPPTPKKLDELSESERLAGLGARHEYNPLDALDALERDDG